MLYHAMSAYASWREHYLFQLHTSPLQAQRAEAKSSRAASTPTPSRSRISFFISGLSETVILWLKHC